MARRLFKRIFNVEREFEAPVDGVYVVGQKPNAYWDLFDPSFYRAASELPDVTDRKALQHYLTTGWRAGLDPSEDFSTTRYLEANPDVADSGLNPLEHYVQFGREECRSLERHRDYRCHIDVATAERLGGWAVDQNNRGYVFEVSVFLDGIFYEKARTDVSREDLRRKGLSDGVGGFEMDLPLQFLEPGEHTVTIVLPDDSRMERKAVVPHLRSDGRFLPPERPALEDARLPKVIVPIYNAADDLEVCIARLKAYTPDNIKIILIDDCSTDHRIDAILTSLQNDPRFRVLSNDENIGFTRTVNRGFEEAGDADVVALNSDARVTPRWIEGMMAAAYSRSNIATVTAMSDRAGAFSAPNIGNDNGLPAGVDEITYAIAFRRRSLRLYPEVPTGNGFCMYIRREAIDTLGPLDAEAFPRGYGEENDFCMRAMRNGWINIIDDATYVFHDRSKSFGSAKTEHLAAGRKVVDARYPEYKVLIRKFHTSTPIRLARFCGRLALQDCNIGSAATSRALFVIATQTGGTPQTNADLMDALSDTFETWVLRCNSRIIELSHYKDGVGNVKRRHELLEPIEPVTHQSNEYDAVVASWLTILDAEVIHIRHLGWHSLSLPKIAKNAGARVIYSLHDFYTLCPSLKLIDHDGVFCEGVCTKTEGACVPELWQAGELPTLKNAWVHRWRNTMADAVSHCDAFVTTSTSAHDRVMQNMPTVPVERFHVIPHGRDFTRMEQLQTLPVSSWETIRVLIPGNINGAKGIHIITEILRLDVSESLEFHILGKLQEGSIDPSQYPRLHIHGTYQRDQFGEKVRAIAPHLGAVLSIWDETFCHTLTEMWSVGLPVAVLDFPTLRMRVENSGAGWVLDQKEPKDILDCLLDIVSDRSELIKRSNAALNWQVECGAGQTRRLMASQYLDVYRLGGIGQAAPKVAVVGPADKSLEFANASTEIRLWERTKNSLDREVTYVRMDPEGLLANMRMGTIAGAIIQRTALQMRLISTFIATAAEKNIPYIYEIDDNLLEVPAGKDPNGLYAAYAPHLKKLMENAVGLTVSTETLAQVLRPYNSNVTVVPNLISKRLWGGVVSKSRERTRRILYMGTKTHSEDLDFVLPILEAVRRRHPSLRLSLIGITNDRALPDWVDVIEVPNEQKSYGRFVSFLREQSKPVDFAIAPLVDTEFNRFKSWLKILDCGAAGLPVVASKVHCYEAVVGKESVTGLHLVRNEPKAWEDTLVRLLTNRSVLQKEGTALRDWVFENHSLEPTLKAYDSLVMKSLLQPSNA